ncbi:formate dehydrogenase accessory sulfurtransferase FdhD [Mycoplasmatota bacterium WC44]
MISCKTAVILAGGESKRMSFNKEFVKEGNEYLVHKTISELKKVFEEIIVVSNNEELYTDCIVLQDEIKNKGPLAGLSVALKKAKGDYIYLIAVDMPYIDLNYITGLMNNKSGYEVYAVQNNKFIEPFKAIYHKECLKYINDSKSLYSLIKSANSMIVDVNQVNSKLDSQKLFFNINTSSDLKTFEDNILSKKVEIDRYYKNELETLLDEVVEEYPITLYINEKKYVTIVCTPHNINELVVGYLKTDGVIDSFDDIEYINIKENRVNIKINKEFETIKFKEQILYSACGVGTDYHELLDEIMIDSIGNDISIETDEVFNLSKQLAQKSELFMNTGGVHSALYKVNDKIIFHEDIGRHNAVDKIMGRILIDDLSIDGILIVSGRLSSDMVLKTLFMKIPIVISRSAPTTLAVNLAEKYGITLVGFARSNKMNVYTHKYRIKAS